MGVGHEQIWPLLDALAESAAFVRRGTEEHQQDPVTLRLLALAEERGRVRPSEITAILELSAAAVTRRVRALEHAGHLAAVPDQTDGRAYFVELTEAGRRYLADFRLDLSQRFAAVLGDWSVDEVSALLTLLTRLNQDMRRHQSSKGSRGAKPWWRTRTTTA